ncbi:hypothetical protein D6817_00240 [Candidatus Pacearchaeota archaeon]|nr:MAG: hypothetical protein D6817_00240 [Candidatus Pacearchaeota archaeon]
MQSKKVFEKFEKAKATEHDNQLLSPFLVQITEKYFAKEELSEGEIREIVRKLGLRKVILQVAYSIGDFVKPKVKELKLFEFGCNLYFEHTGKNFFAQRKKLPPGVWDIFFICRNNFIVVWDHDNGVRIFKYKRLKASKI